MALLSILTPNKLDTFSSNFYQHHNFYNLQISSPSKYDVTYSLRNKSFQSSYCAKGRAEAKKRLKGEGRRGNACPQTPRFWKTPLDISRFGSFVN